MKTRSRQTKLITMAITLAALAAVWVAWGEDRAQAVRAVQLTSDGFGIAQGQTARVTVLNYGEALGWHWDAEFLDAAGNTLAETRDPIFLAAGQMSSFDVSEAELDAARDRFGRIQMRVVVSVAAGPHVKGSLGVSVELFDNATGQTAVFIGDPNE